NWMYFRAVVPIDVESIEYVPLCQDASWRAWVTVACIDSMVVVIELRPLSAALSVFTPLVIESSRLDSSWLRVDRAAAVKKFTALSRAELTFLPVARRSCVVCCRLAVFCSESRFCRMPAVKTMSLLIEDSSNIGAQAARASRR